MALRGWALQAIGSLAALGIALAVGPVDRARAETAEERAIALTQVERREPSATERAQLNALAATREQFIQSAKRTYSELLGARKVQGEPLVPTVLQAVDEQGRRIGSMKGEPGIGGNGVGQLYSDWSAYTGTFGLAQSAHLLHRAMIGPKIPEIRAGVTNGLNTTVTNLTATRPQPAAPGMWALEPLPDMTGWTQQQFDSLNTLYFTRHDLLRFWWIERILSNDPGMTEAMTLFWHDHFATGISKVYIPSSMYKQNQLLRQYALGNVKDLVQAICVDPAMLIWLDGQYNVTGDVNENFARELLELFSMGVGNYSQDDVREAARAFTGYATYDGITTTFRPWAHDYGSKTFLGQTGTYFGHDIVNIVFQQPVTARFICRKLYRYFIDEYPDEALIEQLATTLRNNNYEIKPVLIQMLKSQLFFDVNYRGAIYADAIDRGPAIMRAFDVSGVDFSDQGSTLNNWTLYGMSITGQILLEPPNVAGWPGYRSWENSYVLPWRRTLNTAFVEGRMFGDPLGVKIDALHIGQQLPNPNNASQLVDDLCTCYFGQAPTPLVKQALLNAMLTGLPPDQWNITLATARIRLEHLLTLLMKMADFQLK